jgi:uncharacterized low-complexity protein
MNKKEHYVGQTRADEGRRGQTRADEGRRGQTKADEGRRGQQKLPAQYDNVVKVQGDMYNATEECAEPENKVQIF